MRLPSSPDSNRLARLGFLLAAILALVMALLPHPPHTPLDRMSDKFAHMLAFVVMTVLAILGWPRAPLLRLLIQLSAFGALIEVLQAIPILHRDSQFSDWIADTAATSVVLLLAAAIRARRPLA